MADDSNTNFKQADTQYTLLRKILARLNLGISTSGGGGGGGGGAVTVADGADTTEGAKADAAATDSTSAWTVVSLLKGIFSKLAGTLTATITGAIPAGTNVIGHVIADSGSTTAVTGNVTVVQGTAANLKVDPSGVTSPVSIAAAVTVQQATATNLKVDLSGTAANATAIKVDGSAVTQPISGNIGGFTTVIKDTTAVSNSPAYSAGDAVGGKRTLANAVRSNGSTGVLQSVEILDRANQKAAVTVYIFDADPAAATITDNAAFVFSTDDLKVIAQVSIAASDYVTNNSKAIAQISGLSIPLKQNSAGTSLYAAVVTSGTPTYAATTDVQVTFGILQD